MEIFGQLCIYNSETPPTLRIDSLRKGLFRIYASEAGKDSLFIIIPDRPKKDTLTYATELINQVAHASLEEIAFCYCPETKAKELINNLQKSHIVSLGDSEPPSSGAINRINAYFIDFGSSEILICVYNLFRPSRNQEATTSGLRRGDVVGGIVKRISAKEIIVEIVTGEEGIVLEREVERLGQEIFEQLKIGQEIAVYILNSRTRDNKLIISIASALEELDWAEAERYFSEKQIYISNVKGIARNGIFVQFGRLRGFIPGQLLISSHRDELSDGHEKWKVMLNQPIAAKVITVDRKRDRLILSEVAAGSAGRKAVKDMILHDIRIGEIRAGWITNVVPFGAFVDIGGAEGLVHLTELSWEHVTDPRQVVSEGQRVQVSVIEVNPERSRIGLSIKQCNPDPWDTIAINYSEGQLIEVEISKITRFGAFARLIDIPEAEGLIHISELATQHVSQPRDIVEVGEKLTVRIIRIDIENRRLGLSLKRVFSTEYLDMDL